jgi:hypothetical protein
MAKAGHSVLFKAFIDDSKHKDVFTLCALLGWGTTWGWVISDWLELMESKNRELALAGRKQFKRYHASDCSNRKKEFSEWTLDEQRDFTGKMLGLFSKESNNLGSFSVSTHLGHLTEVFPEAAADPQAFASTLLLSTLMEDIYQAFIEARRDVARCKIAMVHERGDYNASLQRAFDSARHANRVPAGLFPSLTPMGWEDCTPLQPADFMAYEHCKEVERMHFDNERGTRHTFKVLASEEAGLFGHGSYFFKPELIRVKDETEPGVIQQLLVDANLAKSYSRHSSQS